MSPAGHLAIKEGFSGETERRKRLGQYFSGIGLARLLGSLAAADQARSIVDPMGGTGDMLVGCITLGARPEHIGSIEIDPIANSVCRERLPDGRCLLGNAFDPELLAKLQCSEWDLVITNPPYVRYQSLSKKAGKDFKLPDADSVRKGLIAALDGMSALDETDLTLFKAMAKGYSGLADLAVPSWILCAAMVAVGGRLALVVPEAWLSRDYAAVVHYLLLRWFRIEYIIEDEHAGWFEDAQIKTTLLVARRIERRDDVFNWKKTDFFARGQISGNAASSEGPIANLFPGKENSEDIFTRYAKKVLKSGISIEDKYFAIFPAAFGRVAKNLQAVCSRQKWFKSVGEDIHSKTSASSLPEALVAWLGRSSDKPFDSLEAIGVSVGQGLRTGANDFFYVTYLSDNGSNTRITTKIPGFNEVILPTQCVRPVLRRQAELPEGFTISTESLPGRVLDLRSYALLEDILISGEEARKTYIPLQESCASFIRQAKRTNIGTVEEPKYIPELSAVAPNIRTGDPSKGLAPRFWYMLPDFARRHMPDVLVPRVNSMTPKAWLVADPGILVDANFVTLNVSNESKMDKFALLAFLNSTWSRAVLEHGASVMGGGALKVESTHLRRMPVPKFTDEEFYILSTFGRRMAKGNSCLQKLDEFIVTIVLDRKPEPKDVESLSLLVEKGKSRRESPTKRKVREALTL